MNRVITAWLAQTTIPASDAAAIADNLRKSRYTRYDCMLLLPSTAIPLPLPPADLQSLYAQIAIHLHVTHIAISRPIPAVDPRSSTLNHLRSPAAFEPVYGDFGTDSIALSPSTSSPRSSSSSPPSSSSASCPLPPYISSSAISPASSISPVSPASDSVSVPDSVPVPVPAPVHPNPSTADFAAAFWVAAKQNGVYQAWAPRWTMFSRGNVAEKARLLTLPSVRGAVEDGERLGCGDGGAEEDVGWRGTGGWHRQRQRQWDGGREGVGDEGEVEAEEEEQEQEQEKGGMERAGRGERGEELLPGCAAVDLYVGIGYFAFSYLKAGVRVVLGWDLNGWSLEGLRRGAEKNRWDARIVGDGENWDLADGGALPRVIAFRESNEKALARIEQWRHRLPPVRHVNCGLLPTSRGSWETAVAALDARLGGWVHVHENFAVAEIEAKAEEVRATFQRLIHAGRHRMVEVRLEEIHRLKSYAPGVIHCVLDIHVPPTADSV